MGSLVVRLGQRAIVVGAIVAASRSWRAVGAAVAFLALAVLRLIALGDTDDPGRGQLGQRFHGFPALVVLLAALRYAQWSTRILGVRPAARVGGG